MNKTIFWDFDGTLVYADHLWSNSIYTVLKRRLPDTDVTFRQVREMTYRLYPWDTPEEDYTAVTGTSWWKYMERQFYKKYVQAGIPQEIADLCSREIRGEILQVEKYHLFPDTRSTLEACRRLGYQNIVLSNNYPELEDMMEELDLRRYFDGVIVSALAGYDKPRQEIFQIALKAAGNPRRCYMVGDNPRADILGAKQAGMETIFVHREEPCEIADYKLEHLGEILEIPQLLS